MAEVQQASDLLGDAITTVEATTQSSAASKQALHLPEDLEVSSPAPAPAAAASNTVGAFGFGSPAAPTSPLDAPAKTLNFEGAKVGTPAGADAAPPTPLPSPAPFAGLTALASLGEAMSAATVAPATPTTPAPAVSATAAPPGLATASTATSGENVEGPIDYDTFVKDTLLWVNKVRSAVYLVGGLLAVYVAHQLLSTDVTLVTGVCWVLLAQAGLNVVRGFINPKLQARCTWQDSALTSFFLSSVSSAVRGAAVLHDKHLMGDVTKLLRIVVVLWAVSLAGRLAGATGLAAALWVLAFTLPKAYTLYQSKVDKVVSDVFEQAKSQFLKLDAKARAALIVVPTFVAGYLLSSADLCIALLALALYGRSLMAQAQVDKVNAAVAPVSATVSKVGGTVGGLVQSAVVKYELTPTPAKRKRE